MTANTKFQYPSTFIYPYDFKVFVEKKQKNKYYFMRRQSNKFVVANDIEDLEKRARTLLQQEHLSESELLKALATEETTNLSAREKVRFMERSHEIDPTTESSVFLAKNAASKNQYEKAIDYLGELEEKNVDSYLIYAKYYELHGKYAKQQDMLELAFELDEYHEQVLYDRGHFYYNKVKQCINDGKSYSLVEYEIALHCIKSLAKDRLVKVENRQAQLNKKFIYEAEDYIFVPAIHLLLIGKLKKEAKVMIKSLLNLYPFKEPEQIDEIIQNDLLIEFSEFLTEDKLKLYRNKTKVFLNEFVGTLHYYSAFVSLLKDNGEKAIKKLTKAIRFMPQHEEWQDYLKQVKQNPEKTKKLGKKIVSSPLSSAETIRQLKNELLERAKRLEILERIEQERKGKLETLEKMYQSAQERQLELEAYHNELFEQEKYKYEQVNADYLDEEEAIQNIEDEISVEQFDRLKSFDTLCQKRLEKDFPNNKQILNILPIHKQLIQAEMFYQCIIKLNIDNLLDNTIIIESYFKVIEILMAKMIGEVSYGSILYIKSQHRDQYKRIIGCNSDYYTTCTLGNYTHYVKDAKQYDSNNIEPVYATINKNELFGACQSFTKIRNKYSHKLPLPFEEVGEVRVAFYRLLKQLLHAFIEIPPTHWEERGVIQPKGEDGEKE